MAEKRSFLIVAIAAGAACVAIGAVSILLILGDLPHP